MDKEKLYFIALVPGKELREEVRVLKEQMQARFHAGHALKSPAHITLQMPFRVELNGFGAFAPKVIFIKVIGYDL